jgi:hypothetical protein
MPHFRMPCRCCALLTTALLAQGVVSAWAQAPGPQPPEPTSAETQSNEWDPTRSWQSAVSAQESVTQPVTESPLDFSTLSGSKAEASKFANFKLPSSGWSAKAGVDYAPASTPAAMLQSDLLLPEAVPRQQSGPAWAKVTAPALDLPLSWDQASIETRFDPAQDQSKLGMSFSRSLPLGSSFSVTLQNGYSVTQTLPMNNAAAHITTLAPTGAGAAATSATNSVLDTNQALRFNILPSNTSVSLGATLSTTDDKWLPSVSAEQKLFGGPFNITGSVSETATGEVNKTIKGGFKNSW